MFIQYYNSQRGCFHTRKSVWSFRSSSCLLPDVQEDHNTQNDPSNDAADAYTKFAALVLARTGTRAPHQIIPSFFTTLSTPNLINMNAQTLDPVDAAVADYRRGIFPSIRAAAKAYHVAESTTRDRYHGKLPRRNAHSHEQLLSPTQERMLAGWAIDLEVCGQAPTHTQLRIMASVVSQSSIWWPGSHQRQMGAKVQASSPTSTYKEGRRSRLQACSKPQRGGSSRVV